MPLSGILFVALILGSVFMMNTPGADASAVTVLTYYRAHGNQAFASALLIGLGVIAGVFFYGHLREYLRQDRATRWLASTGFGGALVFAVGGTISAGAFATLSDKPQDLTPAAAQTINLIQTDLSSGMAQAGLGVFYLATAAAILRGGLLPAWLGWVSVILGLVAASLILTFFAFIATGAWVVVVAVMLWARASREPAGQQSAPRGAEYAARR